MRGDVDDGAVDLFNADIQFQDGHLQLLNVLDVRALEKRNYIEFIN